MKRLISFTLIVLSIIFLTGCAKDSPEKAQAKQSDQLKAARDHFEAEKDPPLTANTRFAAGQLAEAQGNPQMAAKQYQEAIKLDEKFLPAIYRLGVVQAQMKDFESAINTWQKYIKLTKGSSAGYSNLGFAYELEGNTQQAELAYKKGIAADPKNEACRTNYGLMLARLDRIDEAKAQLSTVLTEGEVHYNLASVYETRGRKDLARVEYRKALQLDPNLRDAQVRLAALD